MKKAGFYTVFVLITNCLSGQQFTNLYGDYLGQAIPGDTPLVFAPGIVSSDYLEHSPAIFSRDGNEVFWEVIQTPDSNSIYHIRFTKSMRRINNKWTRPVVVPYTNPFLSIDGKYLYFSGYDHGFCMVEKTAGGWGKWQIPDLFSGNPELMQGFHFSIAQDGTLYFSCISEGLGTLNDYGIYRSELVDGKYQPSELLPPNINQTPSLNWTPFIAPDESYLLFSSNRHSQTDFGDLYITFRLSDGNWSEPLNLGEPVNSRTQERFPGISPDGMYLFFTRWTKEHDQDVFWVSTGVIEEIKKNREKKIMGKE